MITPLEILWVEDNANQIGAIWELFKVRKIHNNFTVVADRQEALALLNQEGEYAANLRPHLIFVAADAVTDDMAEWTHIANNRHFSHIPLIVVADDDQESADVRQKAEQLGISPACYLQKPITFPDMMQVVGCLTGFGVTFTHFNF
ncbi:MAG: hypothetical protein CL610_28265 [Anaerolineaceae bacterium]|nr:hypothetical protein [Anaerolineaceae bacterium]